MKNLSLIRTFLRDRLDIDPERVTLEASLKDLDVDSLMLLELLFEFEEKMNVNLSRCMAIPRTVGELIAIVEQRKAAQATK